ncbi:increased DNA methylation 1-like isoform X1 [Gossypium australe]|uniref:Increased DNA methylation 1-like isoform X1 n=1 Tax=Gossypium australe TaxID=47621 RepID=A0A5B6WXT1_9ROSI|nr:increased DNA methylation 1-like isoform X1 [Gossypium australe]
MDPTAPWKKAGLSSGTLIVFHKLLNKCCLCSFLKFLPNNISARAFKLLNAKPDNSSAYPCSAGLAYALNPDLLITPLFNQFLWCKELAKTVHWYLQLYSGLSSRLGMINHLPDGFSWTLLKCIHEDQKVYSAQRFALKAECNSKLAVALSIMEECFQSMVDPRTGVDMIPQLLYNWGSDFARLNFFGFYSLVLEKDDVLISVASIRIHGVTVAEMPLIATCINYRRQGMCRRLMNVIEEMLISFKVEKLVITAIPNLVETWTKGFGFTPVEEDERKMLKKINLMVFPGTILLKKPLYQETTDIVIHSIGDQHVYKANAEIGTKLAGDKNLQESEIDGMKEIKTTDAGEVVEKPTLRVTETTRLGICTAGELVDEYDQCSDHNRCSAEPDDGLNVGPCRETPAAEINSAAQFESCCGDNEAGTEPKAEFKQQLVEKQW